MERVVLLISMCPLLLHIPACGLLGCQWLLWLAVAIYVAGNAHLALFALKYGGWASVLLSVLNSKLRSSAHGRDNFPVDCIQLIDHVKDEDGPLVPIVFGARSALDHRLVQLRDEEGGIIQIVHTFAKFFVYSATGISSHRFPDRELLGLCKAVIGFVKIGNSLVRHVESVGYNVTTLAESQSDTILVSQGERELLPDGREKEAMLDIIPVSLGQHELVGRVEEKERILRFLRGTGTDAEPCSYVNVEVLTIIGDGGVGKTALAQWAYNDQTVQQHFGVKGWAHASEVFSLERIMSEIVTSASIQTPHDFLNFQDLDKIQDILSKGLEGKRFLIVLDDLCNIGDVSNWEFLLETFKLGKQGSRVLITTRSETAARIIGALNRMDLKALKSPDRWSLFKQCAFGDENPKLYPQLLEIAHTLANMLGGLPLEVKILGALLKSNFNEAHWRDVLDKFSKVQVSANCKILPCVSLCYDFLPEHLKQCFAYCSLFPKDYGFEKDRLVQIWMALGFILPIEEKKMEDMARDYFDELARRSFFEKKRHQDGYVIHDLLHDAACSASRGECHVIEEHQRLQIPEKVRHLHIRGSNIPVIDENSSKHKMKHIRSLIFHGQVRTEGLAQILKECKELRVLIFSQVHVEFLPECIGKLIHLRYLELCQTDILVLPKQVCRLYHLQGLDMRYCPNLRSLPSGWHNLVNLRYLKQ